MKNKNDFNNDSIENIEKTIAELKKEQAEYERKRNGIIITNKFKLIINAVLNNDKTFDKISSTKDDEIGIVFESMFNSEEFHALFDKFSNDDKINNFRQKKARKAENRKKRNQGKNIEKTDNEISIKEGGAEVVTHETVVRPQASTINGTAPSGLMLEVNICIDLLTNTLFTKWSGKATDVKDLHNENWSLPISTTLSGITMVLRDLQS